MEDKKADMSRFKMNSTINNDRNSYKPQTMIENKSVNSGYHKPTSGNLGIATRAVRKGQNELDKIDDIGSKSVAGIINGTLATTHAIKNIQTAAPKIGKVATATGRGVYRLARGTYHVAKSVDSTVAMIKTGHITVGKAGIQAINRLKNTAPVKGIIHRANTLKIYTLKVAGGTVKTVRFAQGVLTGTIKVHITKEQLKNLAKSGIKTSGAVVGYGLKTGSRIARSGYHGSIRTLKGGNRIATGVTGAARNIFNGSDDMGSEAFGMGIRVMDNTLRYTPKVITKTVKGIKTGTTGTIKAGKGIIVTSVKTGKGLVNMVGMFKHFGGKATFNHYRVKFYRNMQTAIAKAGNSIVTVIMNLLKALKSKIIIPVIIVVAAISCGYTILTIPVAGVSSLFSGWCSDGSTGADIDTHAWLQTHIASARTDFVQEIKDLYNGYLKANGGSYDIVRLFTSKTESGVVLTNQTDLSDTSILNSIWSETEYLNLIEPVFYTIMLSEYNLEPTQAQMQTTFDELWDVVTTITTAELPMEYCGTACSCGMIHADISTCPNYTSGTHAADHFGCSICCYRYYTCNGHTSLNSDGTYSTSYCSSGEMSGSCSNSSSHSRCNGYSKCNGHKIMGITISAENYDALLNKYYINRIRELEARASLTADEAQELQDKKDYYDFCVAYQSTINENFGGGGAIVSYDDVVLDNVTEFACRYVGYPYVWGGTSLTGGIDCSGFTQAVYKQVLGIDIPHSAASQSAMGTPVASISDAKAGDLIFYYDGGAGVHHVAMYLGNGKMVHASNSKPYPDGGIKISVVYGTEYFIKRFY